jgi:hypothetical protein
VLALRGPQPTLTRTRSRCGPLTDDEWIAAGSDAHCQVALSPNPALGRLAFADAALDAASDGSAADSLHQSNLDAFKGIVRHRGAARSAVTQWSHRDTGLKVAAVFAVIACRCALGLRRTANPTSGTAMPLVPHIFSSLSHGVSKPLPVSPFVLDVGSSELIER